MTTEQPDPTPIPCATHDRCAFSVLPTENYAYRAECDCGWTGPEVSRFTRSADSAMREARKAGTEHYFGPNRRRPVLTILPPAIDQAPALVTVPTQLEMF